MGKRLVAHFWRANLDYFSKVSKANGGHVLFAHRQEVYLLPKCTPIGRGLPRSVTQRECSGRARDDVVRRSTLRPDASFLDQLLYPAEAPLPGGAPIKAIALAYPPGDAGISGWDNELTWMGIFFVLSLVFAFALRGPLGVTI